MLKICSKCKVEKPVDCFGKKATSKDGYRLDCKQCRKEESKAWYRKNKEVISIKDKLKYAENKELFAIRHKRYYISTKSTRLERCKQYRDANKDILAIKHKQYRTENKNKITVRVKKYLETPMGKASIANRNHKRRAITKQGDVNTRQLLQLRQSATHCFWCASDLKETGIHIDHLHPLSKGGAHTISNLVVSCPTCNRRKGSKNPIEFAKIIFKEGINDV